MVDGRVQGILRSVKLLWDTQPKAIRGTTSGADPSRNCGLLGGRWLSAVSSVVHSVSLCCRVQTVEEKVSGAKGRKQRRFPALFSDLLQT